MSNNIEESFINHFSASLLLFQKQSVAYRFQCPYCQVSGKKSNGKPLSPSDARGYLYPTFGTWNYKCQKCGARHSFEKFLEAQFPLLHFEYVRLRDQLGTTGFQSNCPSLETLLKKRGMLGNQPAFSSESARSHLPRPAKSPAAPQTPSAPKGPNVTKLPPMLSPQQQAGHQSRLNHLLKQRQQQRRLRRG